MKLKLIILFFVLFFLFSFRANAAELFCEVNNDMGVQRFAQGDEFMADIFLNTKGDLVNAVGGNISFPASLELKEVRDGNSIVKFWATEPKIGKAKMINYSGIIPGGYNGAGLLFSLVFTAKTAGSGSVGFDNNEVLLNDGKGTEASLKVLPMQFVVSAQKIISVNSAKKPIVNSKITLAKDTQPPADFTPAVVQNSQMFNSKYFLVFATQDNGGGIDHYEVSENGKWVTAVSPYVLQDQSLRSYIYVKAVDKSGNQKTETVAPRYPVKWYEKWWLWFVNKLKK